MILNYLNSLNILLASLFLAVLVFASLPIIWVGILFIIFLFLLILHTKKDIILFFIFGLLVITSDISETLRIILNSAAFIYLLFVYLKDYGLEFSISPKFPKRITYFIFFIIISMTLSTLFSVSIFTGLNEVFRQITFFLLVYLMYVYVNKDEDAFRYMNALIASGVAVALMIIFTFLTSNKDIYLLESQGLIHEGGIFNNVAAAGGIFAASIPLTFIFLLYNIRNNKRLSLFLFGILFIQILGIFLTNSRASIFAVFLSLLIITYMLKRKTFYKLIISGAVIFILLFILLPVFTNDIDTYFRVNRILENTRYILWDMSFGIIKDNPIWGTGPGLFKNYMYQHIPVMLGSWDESQIRWVYDLAGLGESHNFLLFRTSETGILGLVSVIILPIIFISYCKNVISKYINNKKIYYLGVAIFAYGISMFIRSFYESTGLISNGWIIRDLPFWLCFSVIIYLENRKKILDENTNFS